MIDQLVLISESKLRQIFAEELNKAISHLQNSSQLPKKTKTELNYLTVKEVCSKLKISKPTLHKYSENGPLKSHNIGRRVLYVEDEINASMKNLQALVAPRKKKDRMAA